MDLDSSSTGGSPTAGPSAPKKAKGKTIEERYQKKSQLEHILLRPDTYVGSCELHQQTMWVWSELEQKMVWKNISYVPGLYKIFDEILVNAADVKAREEEEKKVGASSQRVKMTSLKVEIDRDDNSITVWNDGEGIPVEVHKEHHVYVPELIFGHLLTSDNYDDTEARVTGGRNGFGAKLTNIFSSQFSVEAADSQRKRKIKIVWRKNMSTKSEAKVTDYGTGTDYVKVRFVPDFAKFGMDGFDDDILSLLYKRVYDCAGTTGCKVFLNGKRIVLRDFKAYVDLYLPNDTEGKDVVKIHEKQGRWELVVAASESGQFQQVSFVNSINTSKGGTHVSHVVDPLVQSILKKVSSKNKGGMEIKPTHVKSHLWVFVKALIVNPAFDSQTKETLTTKSSRFGSKCELSDKTVAAVIKSPIVENILMWIQTKQQVELQRKMKGQPKGRSRINGIPKLEDANEAGGRRAEECTLILTEGDSAKTSCIAGLSVVGRDTYGVFPLRGKPLNVRDAKFKQLTENAEINNILQILGLQVGKKFESSKGLRYGSVMIMTDQDYDGSHIKGLLLNMLQSFWPDLLKVPGFVKEFVTPIVKVHRRGDELAFFTIPEYEEWKRANRNGKGWKIKYYKGLGTSTDKEFKEYFTALESHQIDFEYQGQQDFEAIDMAFNKKRTEDRKTWLLSYEDGTYVDHRQPKLTYEDFINKELVLFSKYDTERSIPSVCDGLKPGQRKVIFAVIKRNLRNELKVAQLAGYVAEHACYHHGETALQSTIVGMAQTFVGSNNVNLLEPSGQFGSRKDGGKDASAARYIFTRMTMSTRNLFVEADDPLLSYQNEEGVVIEPKYYLPVVPIVLINGGDGIGTGWSCTVPQFNPADIITNLRRYIRGEVMEPMTPWYKGFKGTIERNEKSSGFETVGIAEVIDDETVEVTELPVRKWTQDFKTMLEGMRPDTSETRAGTIVDYRDNSTHCDVHFTITFTPEQLAKAEREGLTKFLKLRTSLPTTNMTLFDPHGKVKRYDTELDIMREFADLRMELYKTRKAYLIDKLERDHKILDAKVRFLLLVIADDLRIQNKKKALIIKELLDLGFLGMSSIKKDSRFEVPENEVPMGDNEGTTGAGDDDDDDGEDNSEEAVVARQAAASSAAVESGKDFDYLLSMPLWNLTMERVEALRRELEAKVCELQTLLATPHADLWESDLCALELVLEKQREVDLRSLEDDRKFKRARRDSVGAGRRGRGGTTARSKAKAKPKAAAGGANPRPAAKQQRTKLERLSEDEDSISASDSDSDGFQDGDDDDDKRIPPKTSSRSAAGPISSKLSAPKKAQPASDESPRPSTNFSLAQRLQGRGREADGESGNARGGQMTLDQMFKGEAGTKKASTESRTGSSIDARFDSLSSWLNQANTVKTEAESEPSHSAPVVQPKPKPAAPTATVKTEKKPKAKAKAATAKRKASVIEDSDSDSVKDTRKKPSKMCRVIDSDFSDASPAVPSPAASSPSPVRLRKPTQAAKSRLTKKKIDSEDEFDESESSDDPSADGGASDSDDYDDDDD